MALVRRYDAQVFREAKYNEAAYVLTPFEVIDDTGATITVSDEATVTATIKAHDGTEISGVATGSVSNGLVTVTLDTTDDEMTRRRDYICELVIEDGDDTYSGYFLFDIVTYPFKGVFSETNLPPDAKKPRAHDDWTPTIQYVTRDVLNHIRVMQRLRKSQEEETVEDAVRPGYGALENWQPGLIKNPDVFVSAFQWRVQFQLSVWNKEPIEEREFYEERYNLAFSAAIASARYDEDDDNKIEETEKPDSKTKFVR